MPSRINPSSPKRHTHRRMIRTLELESCINCDWWEDKDESCFKYKVTPPIDVIVFGCEEWTDPIPF